MQHPSNNIQTGTQVVVRNSQVAVYSVDGAMQGVMKEGRHTFNTPNSPKLLELTDSVNEGKNPFFAELHFVNLVEQHGIKWGTDARSDLLDPVYGVPISIGCSGELGVGVLDPQVLIERVVGAKGRLTRDDLTSFTRTLVNSLYQGMSYECRAQGPLVRVRFGR